jgi:protein-S-isoprenylcysteine O-methyltransferase Ste14
MLPYVFLAFAIICLAQRGAEILRNDRNVAERRPNWTAIAITVIFLGFTAGSVMEVFVVERPFHLAATVAGALLFACGFALRRWVLLSLGRLWAIDIDLKPGHYLVTTGPYRFCRHPNYLAMLLEMAGFCLIGNAFYSLAVCFPLYASALAARIRLEEAALLTLFGDRYRVYRKSTFALMPFPKPGRRNPQA